MSSANCSLKAFMVESIRVRARGVLYMIEIEIEDRDLDWLDRLILDICATPKRVDELLKCFGLPRRMMENAIGRLMEHHLLLLDVAHATVCASGIPPQWHAAHRKRESLLVWQDHATGTLLPWEVIKPWCRPQPADANDPREVLEVRGGPPRRTVLEMSEAELLSALERFRRDWGWAEQVAQRERLRVETLQLNAGRLPSGQIALAEQGESPPWILIKRWAVEGHALSEAEMPTIELPEPWSKLVRGWAEEVRFRLDVLADRKEATPEGSSTGLLRATLENHLRVEFSRQGTVHVRERLRDAGRRVVICVSGEEGFGDALTLAHATEDLVPRPDRLVVVGGRKLDKRRREKAKEREIGVVTTDADCMGWVLVDERELILGGMRASQDDVIRLVSSRPLLGYSAWPPEAGDQAASLGRSAPSPIVENLIGRLTSLVDSVQERERSIPASPAPHSGRRPHDVEGGGLSPSEGEKSLERLTSDLMDLETDLLGLQPAPVTATSLDHELVLASMEGSPIPDRVIVRSESSALALAVPPQVDLVVVSRVRPGSHPSARWLEGDGVADFVVFGDVVVFGFGGRPGCAELPPFIAVHDPKLAHHLLDSTARPAPPPGSATGHQPQE